MAVDLRAGHPPGCDLRSPAERGEPPSQVGERPRILSVGMLPDDRTSGVEVMRRISSDPSGRAAGELLAENYALMPASFDPGLRTLVTSLIDDGKFPVLIMCREGKDRTGFACTLLLLALGVDPDEVLAEYLRSDASFDRDAVAAAVSAHLGDDAPRVTDAVIDALRVRDTYLVGALRAIDERYGSIEQYLERVGGIDEQRREQLRTLFVEPRGGKTG
jgi:protein-tyrosine phosphatase